MSAVSLAGWAFEALIASTLLMAAVLLVRRHVRRAFGAQVAYALWALPVLRLLLPPLPQGWRDTAATPITRATETITVYVAAAQAHPAIVPASVAAPSYPSLGQIMVVLWAAGALAFLAWHLVGHARFCRAMLARGQALETIDGVRVIESAAAPGPLAFGVVNRYVAFPRDFADRYDEDERALALAHEIGHHQRGDLIANWIALAVLAFHWFNPLAWRAFHAFRTDQELANDARVLAGRSLYERHAYACAIVKTAHGGAVSAACHLHTIADLKGRLKMLTVSRASRRRLLTGVAAVSTLMLAGLGLTASGTSAATVISTSVARTTGLQLAPSAPPAPPAPDVAEVPDAPDAPAAPVAPPPPIGKAHHQVSRSITTITDDDGKTKVRVVNRNGTGETIDVSGTDVSEANCPGDDDKPLVLHSQQGTTHRMTICTNRIARVSAVAMQTAARSAARSAARAAIDEREIQRHALAAALSGLEAAKASLRNNPNLTADQRDEALAGIDEGMAEVREQIGKPGD